MNTLNKQTVMVSEALRQTLRNEYCLIRFAAVFNGLFRRVIYVFSKNMKKWSVVQTE